MNYLGSKSRLLSSINSIIEDFTKGEPLNYIADVFAGTGCVGKFFKKKGFRVYSNDLLYSSYVLNRHYIENNKEIEFLGDLLIKRNNIINYDFFISKNYTNERMYFSPNNASFIDVIRTNIENERLLGKMDINSYFFHIVSLLESLDLCANTTAVYSAFLKKYKSSAKKLLQYKPAECILSDKENKAFNMDAKEFVKLDKFDIVFLDPPYNHRQYSSNYHILDTVAKWDFPEIKGKTGLRKDCFSSKYCSKTKALNEFTELIKNINSKYIFMTYNEEGILDFSHIKKVLSSKGKYSVQSVILNRYKADSKRSYKTDKVVEYIHCVKCN